MLSAQPDAIGLTTGDGRTPLHVLALCDDGNDRLVTLEVLLRHSPNTSFAEPFFGNTPLHVAAREGHSEVAIRLLEAGADGGIANEAGRTALDEARAELATLEAQADASTAARRSRLANTVMVMEIAAIAT